MLKKYITFLILCLINFSAYATCSLSVSSVAFGTYNPFSNTSDDSVGNIALNCKNGSNYKISLSKGNSSTYSTRTLKTGVNILNYNLYTNSVRRTIWGDGTQGTSIISGTCNGNQCQPRNIPIYGRIPAGQDCAVGNYSDNITVTVNF